MFLWYRKKSCYLFNYTTSGFHSFIFTTSFSTRVFFTFKWKKTQFSIHFYIKSIAKTIFSWSFSSFRLVLSVWTRESPVRKATKAREWLISNCETKRCESLWGWKRCCQVVNKVFEIREQTVFYDFLVSWY